MKILIVDDETPIREWIQFCIERSGDESLQIVGSAKNGKEAYELFVREQPDVVISDIKMPVMDGIELLKKVFAQRPETIFLILTNHAEFTYAQEAIAFGAKKYLLKSQLRGEELLAELHSIARMEQEKAESYSRKQEQVLKEQVGETVELPVQSQFYSQTIQDALCYLEEHYQEDISLVDVARHVYRSSEYFSRRFKAETGENFSIYLMMYRMKKARELLQSTELKIYQIANQVGYESPGYFTKIYRRYMGESPEDTKRQYRNRRSK